MIKFRLLLASLLITIFQGGCGSKMDDKQASDTKVSRPPAVVLLCGDDIGYALSTSCRSSNPGKLFLTYYNCFKAIPAAGTTFRFPEKCVKAAFSWCITKTKLDSIPVKSGFINCSR